MSAALLATLTPARAAVVASLYRGLVTSHTVAITLADLTNGNAARYGVPTDVIRYSDHAAGQHFSEFVHSHMPDVDGILYRSRLAERLCIAIYDRAIGKLSSPTSALPLTRARLAPTLGSWNIRVR